MKTDFIIFFFGRKSRQRIRKTINKKCLTQGENEITRPQANENIKNTAQEI